MYRSRGEPVAGYAEAVQGSQSSMNLVDFEEDDFIVDPEENEIFYDASDDMFDIESNMFDDGDQVDDPYSDDIWIDSKPLYPGCEITVGAFMLLLATFVTKHNIIGDGIQQLLNIIGLVLPTEHRLCKSLYYFKEYFKNLRNPLIKHYYCKFCLKYINEENTERCPNPQCRRQLRNDCKEYFLEISVVDQLRTLFSKKNFVENLQWRFNRPANNLYEDIYDGELYKQMFANGGVLSNENNVSFVLNTDGAPVFKSSKVSIWPIYLIINELPYVQRIKTENMLLAGLWFGSQKPCMGTFLKPFLNCFKQLEVGITVRIHNEVDVLCKGFLLCTTADLPARSLLCNSIQYNGTFSCWKCLQRGESAKVGRGSTMVFPFKSEDPKGPKRTQESVVRDAKAAVGYRETSTCSNHEEIDDAERKVLRFCEQFESLYDRCHMTLNLHQLVHFCDSVRLLGPLYTHSCFHFEDKKGFVLNVIKGTQNIDFQIITGVSFVQKLPELKHEYAPNGSVIAKIYIVNQIEFPSTLKRTKKISDGVYMLGALHVKELSSAEHNVVQGTLRRRTNRSLATFTRINYKDYLIYGLQYHRMMKRNNLRDV
ncbi:hypothetical protein FSP39_014874 [Pinctada imbricata]|uniref:Transposase domain-containing protein n=1 Tax=Pinctada imbricata TaxID=66713 RepID=A0AA89CDD6_PINIB|nr:hypothetical protein FSP39_014874 [Pinctada imbricata]